MIYHPLPEESFDEKYGHGASAAARAAARHADHITEETAKLAARERLKIIALAFLVGVGDGCGRRNRMDGNILPSVLGLVLVIPHFGRIDGCTKGYRIYGFFVQSPFIRARPRRRGAILVERSRFPCRNPIFAQSHRNRGGWPRQNGCSSRRHRHGVCSDVSGEQPGQIGNGVLPNSAGVFGSIPEQDIAGKQNRVAAFDRGRSERMDRRAVDDKLDPIERGSLEGDRQFGANRCRRIDQPPQFTRDPCPQPIAFLALRHYRQVAGSSSASGGSGITAEATIRRILID
jgi:hypothetical protein